MVKEFFVVGSDDHSNDNPKIGNTDLRHVSISISYSSSSSSLFCFFCLSPSPSSLISIPSIYSSSHLTTSRIDIEGHTFELNGLVGRKEPCRV